MNTSWTKKLKYSDDSELAIYNCILFLDGDSFCELYTHKGIFKFQCRLIIEDYCIKFGPTFQIMCMPRYVPAISRFRYGSNSQPEGLYLNNHEFLELRIELIDFITSLKNHNENISI